MLFRNISIYKIQIFSVNTQAEKCTLKKKKLRFSYILTHSGADCEEAEQSTPDLEELEERAKPKKEQEYFSLSMHMVHLVIFRVRSQNYPLNFALLAIHSHSSSPGVQ